MKEKLSGRNSYAMRNVARRILICVPFVLCSLATWSPCRSEEDVAASVNGERITRQTLLDRLLSEFGKSLLENMIDELIVLQEAKRLKVEVTDAEVNKRLEEQKAALPGGQRLENWLVEKRLTLPAWRERLRALIRLEKIVAPEVKVSDDAVANLYLRSPELFDEPERIRIRGIRKRDRAAIERVRKEAAMSPNHFPQLAMKYSDEEISKERGGDLGWRPLSAMQPLGLSAEKLKISEVIVAEDGYWIYQTVDYKQAERKSWKEAEPIARKLVYQEQLTGMAVRRFDELKRKANIERMLFPEEKKKATGGGAGSDQ